MLLNENMSVLFWTKKQRIDDRNTAPVYARVTINGKRTEISTGKRADLDKWNAASGLQKGTDDESVSLNRSLTRIKADLQRHYDRLEALGEIIDVDKVRNAYLGVSAQPKTLKDAFEYHNVQMSELVEKKKVSEITLGRYMALEKSIDQFVKYKYKTKTLALPELKLSFITEFRHFLTVKRNTGANTADKKIGMIKKIINQAVANEWMSVNPFTHFKCKYVDPHREPLSMEEIRMLLKYQFTVPRLDEARDVFIFCCFTGLGYTDVYNLREYDIVDGIDGRKWIDKDRQKTGVAEIVPLLPIAQDIIAKYNDHPHCVTTGKLLRVNSNQKYNAYLKEIADVCGIKKKLTTHIARHTFATTITLEHDVPIESVSKMLGHKSIKSTQIYAKASQRKISNNMIALTDKLFTDGALKKMQQSQPERQDHNNANQYQGATKYHYVIKNS